MYLVVTALVISMIVICATSLSVFRSYSTPVERLALWLVLIGCIPFAVLRAPLTFFLLFFRDQRPSLADGVSSLAFLISSAALVVALLMLPFRRTSLTRHCRAIWILLAILLTSSVAQTLANG